MNFSTDLLVLKLIHGLVQNKMVAKQITAPHTSNFIT